jgi:hypothetical protein
LLLSTVVQCKQRYARTLLPSNVTVVDLIVYYVMRSKNEVLCAAPGRLAAKRSEEDKPAKAHKTSFLLRITYTYLLFFLQTFITNYLRHVKKPGRNFK